MSKEKTYVIDTNSLIQNPYIIKKERVILTSLVLREIEELERRRGDKTLQYNIRVAKRAIEDELCGSDGNIDIIDIDTIEGLDGYDDEYVDNRIIKYAMDKGYGIISDDILLRHKAISKGIDVISSKEKDEENPYKGFKEIELSDVDRVMFYTNLTTNHYNLLVNQYLVVKKEKEGIFDILKWTNGDGHVSIMRSDRAPLAIAESRHFERITAKDQYQEMVIDSLNNTQVTMVRGRAGSGKTLLSLAHAWHLVERDDARLVIFFNPAPSKDSVELGFYKGCLVDKALQSSLGAMLKSKFGDEDFIREQVAVGNIEILPFTDLRGWDSGSERKTVVFLSESQNLTAELLKMGLQRIDDETKVIIDGDFNQQIDKDVYIRNNGMKRASEVLRGSELYSEVELQKVHRSKLADIAEEM